MADQVQCLHLLCKHEGSRNPVSRRTGASTADVKRGDAHAELNTYLEKFKGLSGSDLEREFRGACKARSDCGSFQNEGDLGMFGRGAMQKPFEEASFALGVGEMTQSICDSDSGSHLILRIR